jgi:8-oxo-dGTP pyrophosphatase MutT (NUDIX family)
MELWDAYNSNFEKIEGLTLIREEQDKIPQGVYHLVCEILVRHTDGTYLLMKRDPTKPLFPNMWEATAGGSALQGESPVEGAMRELREETGIEAETLEQLDWSLGKTCIHCRYLCVTNCAKDSIKLQEGETCDYRWVSAEEVLAMPESELVGWQMKKYINIEK